MRNNVITLNPIGPLYLNDHSDEVLRLETIHDIDVFLAGVEKKAFRIAQLAMGNRDDALDSVQDTMLKFVEKYCHKPAEQWKPLFYRILHNCIIDKQRRSGTRSKWTARLPGYADTENGEGEVDAMANIADPGGMDPLAHTLQDSAIEQLFSAIGELPMRQQQAFLLRVWEGLDVDETARSMSCSSGSVKTHFSRAVHFLRERLGEYWP